MVKNPLISVIIPVYKVEPYIDKCIQSIINQTYKNLEIIVVDDASPDNSGKICDKYALNDERIKVIHKCTNTGLSDARNIGINQANGEYIGFVDSDDYIAENMYEDMFNLLKNNNADICICNFFDVINGKLNIKNHKDGIKIYNKLEILEEILIDKKVQSYAWNKLYRKTLFDNIKYPVGKKYEDIGTTFYILEKCDKIVASDEPLYYYLNRKDSIVNSIEGQTIIDYIGIISERYDYIDEKYKELANYNFYSLAKTLLVAYKDRERLKNIEDSVEEEIENLYNKIKEILRRDGEEILNCLDEEMKEELNNLLYSMVN